MYAITQLVLPVVFSALALGSLNAGVVISPAATAENAQATQTVKLRIIGMITPEWFARRSSPCPASCRP